MLKKILMACSLISASLIAAAAPVPPDQAVRDTTEKMQALIKANHDAYIKDQVAFYKVVDEVLSPRFDIKYIAQLILGKYSRSANADQKARFAEAFKSMLIRSYANTLLENSKSVKTEWAPMRVTAGATDANVRVTLTPEGSQPVKIGFSMRLAGEEWKIYDINVEAISLITNFRSQITAEIKRTSLDAVITRLESGGTIKP